jgi:predicted nucleic acid-binding protein
MAGTVIALFDTNIIIDALNGVEAAEEEYIKYESVHISIISWVEVMVGVQQESESVSRFLREAFVVCPFTQSVAEYAVRLRKQYRIKLPDAIIWATAHVNNAVLVTRNTRDFPADDASVRIPYTV